jgi:hypothetical protein
MPEKLNGKSFPELVTQRTLILGGFSLWETTDSVQNPKIPENCHIYAGFVPDIRHERKGLHIIIGNEENGRVWYLATFQGPAWPDMTQQERQASLDRQLDVFEKDGYRVSAEELENRIKKVVLPLLRLS